MPTRERSPSGTATPTGAHNPPPPGYRNALVAPSHARRARRAVPCAVPAGRVEAAAALAEHGSALPPLCADEMCTCRSAAVVAPSHARRARSAVLCAVTAGRVEATAALAEHGSALPPLCADEMCTCRSVAVVAPSHARRARRAVPCAVTAGRVEAAAALAEHGSALPTQHAGGMRACRSAAVVAPSHARRARSAVSCAVPAGRVEATAALAEHGSALPTQRAGGMRACRSAAVVAPSHARRARSAVLCAVTAGRGEKPSLRSPSTARRYQRSTQAGCVRADQRLW